MKTSILIKALNCSVLAPLAVGVVLGLMPSAKAVTVNEGTDYLVTPSGGAKYIFPSPIGLVNFSGLPIGGVYGAADTVVNRLVSTTAPSLPTLPVGNLISGALPPANVTPIQIVKLSLAAEGPYAGKIFAGLDPSKVSGGEMAIAHGATGDVGGIWSSYFGINGMAVIANAGVTLTPSGHDYVSELISLCSTATDYTCVPFEKGFADFLRTINLNGGSVGPVAGTGASFKADDEPWTHLPTLGQISGPNLVSLDEPNFYLVNPAFHDSGDGTIHNVEAFVPGPLPIVGVSTAYAFARRLRRRCRQAMKAR
jgi:hypothetical protein